MSRFFYAICSRTGKWTSRCTHREGVAMTQGQHIGAVVEAVPRGKSRVDDEIQVFVTAGRDRTTHRIPVMTLRLTPDGVFEVEGPRIKRFEVAPQEPYTGCSHRR